MWSGVGMSSQFICVLKEIAYVAGPREIAIDVDFARDFLNHAHHDVLEALPAFCAPLEFPVERALTHEEGLKIGRIAVCQDAKGDVFTKAAIGVDEITRHRVGTA